MNFRDLHAVGLSALRGPSMNGLPVHGSGLWLARNFTDSLDFSTTDDGFTARLACWTN